MYKRQVFKHAVNRSRKACIALFFSLFRVFFCNFQSEFFKHIFKRYRGSFISCQSNRLTGRNNILYGNVFFRNRVNNFLIVTVVYGDIGKNCNTVRTGFYAVSLAVTCDSKFSASVLIILRLLVDLNRTCFEFVVELYIDSQINVAVGKLDILRLGSFISRIYVDFGYGI